MKIAYGSDLHLGFGPLACQLPDADILVLAGDVIDGINSASSKVVQDFFQSVSEKYKWVIYIMGNHEHYDSDLTKTVDIIDISLGLDNVINLDTECVILDDILFIGSTLWTDLSNPLDAFSASCGMSDFIYINYKGERLTTDTLNKKYEYNLLKIKQYLNEYNMKTVIVTHHAPSFQSIAEFYKNSPLNPAFASDLEDLIIDNENIKVWIHGHTHHPCEYIVGETKVVCNPRGYNQYEFTEDKFQFKVMEI